MAFQMETRLGPCEAGPEGIFLYVRKAGHVFDGNFDMEL